MKIRRLKDPVNNFEYGNDLNRSNKINKMETVKEEIEKVEFSFYIKFFEHSVDATNIFRM